MNLSDMSALMGGATSKKGGKHGKSPRATDINAPFLLTDMRSNQETIYKKNETHYKNEIKESLRVARSGSRGNLVEESKST